MEDQFRIAIVGQELGKNEVNLVAETGALADDRVLAELLRLLPLSTSPSPARGILPASSQQQGSPPATTVSAVVVPSGSADARTIINPFRAVIGPRSTALGKDAYRDIRSAISVGAAADMRQYVTHQAQPTNPRWDLICAAVDVEIDGMVVNRYVKTASTPAVVQSLSTTSVTRVRLDVQQGVPGSTPARPAPPADSAPTYYIPLAYVLLPAGHTLASAIPKANIFECAPVLSISRAMGVGSMAPASGMSSSSGIAVATEGWTPGTGRPKAFLPPTMTGSETVLIALKEISGTRTIALGQPAIIDNTRDWRRRVFRITANAEVGDFAWSASGSMPGPASGSHVGIGVANSLNTTTYAGTSSLLYSFNPSDWTGIMASGSQVIIWVDSSTGFLMGFVGATDPACNFFVWLEASGQFNNAF
jgi:hypothetical protein